MTHVDPIKELPEIFSQGWLGVARGPKEHATEHGHEQLGVDVDEYASLDEKRVIVEKNEEPTIKALKDWGHDYSGFVSEELSFVDSFHCATVDIRRAGCLKSYFDRLTTRRGHQDHICGAFRRRNGRSDAGPTPRCEITLVPRACSFG